MSGTYRPGDGLNDFQTVPPSTHGSGPQFACEGSPEGQIIGPPGAECVDTLTNDKYLKIAGVGVYGWKKNGKVVGYMTVVAEGS